MASKRNRKADQDLGAYLRSQGAASAPTKAGIRVEKTKQQRTTRQRIVWFVSVQAIILIALVVYLRTPVERMKRSILDYNGDGEVKMVSTSFVAYGYVIEMPPFSLEEPFRATYMLGALPWTDKTFAFCAEATPPVDEKVEFKEGRLEIRVFDGETTLLSASGPMSRWMVGTRDGRVAIYDDEAFNLDPAAVLNRESLMVEMNYVPGEEDQSAGICALKVYTGGM